jgi:hypothetical protein
MSRNLSNLINRMGGYRSVGMVLKKKGIRRGRKPGPKRGRRNLGALVRRKRGGFFGALAGPILGAVLPPAIKGIEGLIKKGRGRRGRGFKSYAEYQKMKQRLPPNAIITLARRGRGVKLSGSGVTLIGSGRRGGRFSFGKLVSAGKNLVKSGARRFMKDPIGNTMKAISLGKKLYSAYKGSGYRRRIKRYQYARGVPSTTAPGARTQVTVSRFATKNKPLKTISVNRIKRSTRV